MTDLETRLRSMLNERAEDIDEVPAAVLDRPAAHVSDSRRSHRTPWTIAAAAACVLMIVGVAVAMSHQSAGGRHHPLQHSTSSTAAPPPSVIPTGHAARRLSLESIAFRTLPGWSVGDRSSSPGYRSVSLRARVDHGTPVGCNGCEIASAYVNVFDTGRFDAGRYGVSSWTRTTVNGRPAYRGRMVEFGTSEHPVETLAWRFATDRWALVQGVTAYGERPQSLAKVAASVEPSVTQQIEVPFRLTWLPSTPELPVTAVDDDRADGYALTVSLGPASAKHDDPQVTITVGAAYAHQVPRQAALRTVVDGHVAWFDHKNAVIDIPLPGTGVEIGVVDDNEITYSNTVTAADRTVLEHLVAGLRLPSHSTNLEAAIP